MKILNLAKPTYSEVEFSVSKFPDGQQDIILRDSPLLKASLVIDEEPVEIKSRFTSFKDLELIICATNALRRLGAKKIHLFVPYILGGRSDRQFVSGGTSYLVDVIAPILNDLEFESISTTDPHSDVTAAIIKRLEVEDNYQLMRFALTPPIYEPNTEDNFILVSPDAGALKKVYRVAEKIGYHGNVITCTKDRALNGTLSKVKVPYIAADSTKDLLIIDDICDGGRTFINIAEQARAASYTGKIYLIVTHGIFTQGFNELAKHIDRIYTTNSYRDVSDEEWMETNKRLFVKQLNIF